MGGSASEEDSEGCSDEEPWVVPDSGEIPLGKLLSETSAEDMCESVERVSRTLRACQESAMAMAVTGVAMDPDGPVAVSKLAALQSDLECEARADASGDLLEPLDEVVASGPVETPPGVPEEVLQTYMVSPMEASRDLPAWKAAVIEELRSLIEVKKALRVTDWAFVKNLEKQGLQVAVIPGKVLFSRKAPHGRRKVRIVACGNFLGAQETKKELKSTVYAAGLDMSVARACLVVAARKGWCLFGLDVKTAFLNAELCPRDRKQA